MNEKRPTQSNASTLGWLALQAVCLRSRWRVRTGFHVERVRLSAGNHFGSYPAGDVTAIARDALIHLLRCRSTALPEMTMTNNARELQRHSYQSNRPCVREEGATGVGRARYRSPVTNRDPLRDESIAAASQLLEVNGALERAGGGHLVHVWSGVK